MHIFPKGSFFPRRKEGEVLALCFLPSLHHEMWGGADNTESGKNAPPPSVTPFPPPRASGTFILGDEGRLENSPSLRRRKESEHFFPLLLRERGTERLSKVKKGRTRGGRWRRKRRPLRLQKERTSPPPPPPMLRWKCERGGGTRTREKTAWTEPSPSSSEKKERSLVPPPPAIFP